MNKKDCSEETPQEAINAFLNCMSYGKLPTEEDLVDLYNAYDYNQFLEEFAEKVLREFILLDIIKSAHEFEDGKLRYLTLNVIDELLKEDSPLMTKISEQLHLDVKENPYLKKYCTYVIKPGKKAFQSFKLSSSIPSIKEWITNTIPSDGEEYPVDMDLYPFLNPNVIYSYIRQQVICHFIDHFSRQIPGVEKRSIPSTNPYIEVKNGIINRNTLNISKNEIVKIQGKHIFVYLYNPMKTNKKYTITDVTVDVFNMAAANTIREPFRTILRKHFPVNELEYSLITLPELEDKG